MNLNYISKPPSSGKQGFWKRLWTWRKNKKYDRGDNKRKTQLKRVIRLVAIMVACVVYVQVTPAASNRPSTELNETQQFGTLGKSVAIEESKFSPDTGIMMIRLRVGSGTDRTQDAKVNWSKVDIEFGGQGWQKTNPATKAQIIPISDDTVTVAFENVNPGFQVVELKIKDTQLDASKLTVSQYGDKKEDDEPQIASIIINRDAPKTELISAIPSQKELAIEQMQRKILAANKIIEDATNKNKKIDKEISETRDSIKELETERNYMSAAGKQTLDSQIQDLTKTIGTMNGNKSQNNDVIKDENVKIEMYQTNITNIKNDDAKLGNVQKF